MAVSTSRLLLLSTLLYQLVEAQFQLFPNGTHSTASLSQDCITALNATITCDSYIQDIVSNDYYGSLGNSTLQDSVCATECGTSLASYHHTVALACTNSPQPWPGVPAIWAGDVIWATYNRTCLKDPATGGYCIDEIEAINSNTGSVDQQIFSLPTAQLCTPCVMALLKDIQSTPYSNYDDSYVQGWLAVQSKCNTGPLPTAAQPPVTNITTLPGVVTSNPSNSTCLSGNHYTVQPGDDVQTIAVAHNVATGTLKILNGIFPDGTNLLVGQDLCLPRKCSTYLVQPGDTCVAIAAANDITFVQLISYNPSINQVCTNLIANTNICVGPSGARYTPTTIAGATATSTGYATATVTPPGPVPSGTTRNCGGFYQVNPGDNCQQISLNKTITVDLFKQINPSINHDCTNLAPGLYYCVWPTANWNTTTVITTTSTISPPGPTPTGTTPNCFVWHIVVPGDTCSLLSTEFGITFLQLQSWNTEINSQCSNLLTGEAYCVSAPSTPVSTSGV